MAESAFRPLQAIRQLSSQARQILGVAALLLGGLWLFGVISVQSIREAEVREAAQSNLSLALAHQQRVSSALQLLDQAMLVLRDDFSQAGRPIGLEQRLSALQLDRKHVGIVAIIGPDGWPLETTDPANRFNYSDREYFQYHASQSDDRLLVGKPVIDGLTGQWRISLSRRISQPDGSFGGVVFLALSPDFFTTHTEDADLGPHAAVALLRLDGITLVRRNNDRVSYGEDMKNSQLFKELLKSSSGTYVARASSDDEMRIVSYAIMEKYPLVVDVGSSYDDVMERLRPIENQGWTAGGLLSLLIVALAYVLITRTIQNRLALEQLQLSEARQRAIVGVLPIPIGLSNGGADNTFINGAFTNTFGYSLAEVPTFDAWWTIAFPDPAYRSQVRQAWSEGLKQADLDNSTFGPMQLTIRCKDGSDKIVLASGTPMSLAFHGEYLAAFYDITKEVAATRALESALKDNVGLLNEVHHRVKNNLQVITSLLRLEVSRSDRSEVRTVLQDMQGRILSMSLLHESLYRSGQFAHVDLASYLRQLVSLGMRAFRAGEGEVQVHMDMAQLEVALDRAAPFGLLLNELVSNCMKHGFPNGASGSISVSLARKADSLTSWQLCLSDTGAGLPPDLDIRRAQSLGLQLVFDLVQQIGGQAELHNAPEGGARFCMCFEVPETVTTGERP